MKKSELQKLIREVLQEFSSRDRVNLKDHLETKKIVSAEPADWGLTLKFEDGSTLEVYGGTEDKMSSKVIYDFYK